MRRERRAKNRSGSSGIKDLGSSTESQSESKAARKKRVITRRAEGTRVITLAAWSKRGEGMGTKKVLMVEKGPWGVPPPKIKIPAVARGCWFSAKTRPNTLQKVDHRHGRGTDEGLFKATKEAGKSRGDLKTTRRKREDIKTDYGQPQGKDQTKKSKRGCRGELVPPRQKGKRSIRGA